MPDLQQINKQVRRLGGLQFPPTTPEGWQELSKILQRRCHDLEHVERVIDRWVETEDQCPTPAQLGGFISAIPADKTLDNPVLAQPCRECEPEGLWISVERQTKNGETISVLARCNCARGRQLAALDAQRAKDEAARLRKGPGRIRPFDAEDASCL